MSGIAIGIGAAISIGAGIFSSVSAKKSADKAHELAQANMDMQNNIAKENLKFQKEEAAKLEKQKDVYRNMEFKNPYENMENVYEDLTVDQGQAQFQQQMFQQSQANIMQDLKGAAGGSGIAGLAQALAGQGQLASQQASLSIGQQERANKMAQLGEERNIDSMYRQGEASVDEKEMNRQSTLLGMQMGQLTGANTAVMQSQQNQMAAGAAQANMYGQQAAGQQEAANQMFSTAGNLFGSIPVGG
jgi:predicted small secreted protein